MKQDMWDLKQIFTQQQLSYDSPNLVSTGSRSSELVWNGMEQYEKQESSLPRRAQRVRRAQFV